MNFARSLLGLALAAALCGPAKADPASEALARAFFGLCVASPLSREVWLARLEACGRRNVPDMDFSEPSEPSDLWVGEAEGVPLRARSHRLPSSSAG